MHLSSTNAIVTPLNPFHPLGHEGNVLPITTPHDKKMEHILISTNHFLTSGNVILGGNIEYKSIHSLSGATSTLHNYSSLSLLE